MGHSDLPDVPVLDPNILWEEPDTRLRNLTQWSSHYRAVGIDRSIANDPYDAEMRGREVQRVGRWTMDCGTLIWRTKYRLEEEEFCGYECPPIIENAVVACYYVFDEPVCCNSCPSVVDLRTVCRCRRQLAKMSWRNFNRHRYTNTCHTFQLSFSFGIWQQALHPISPSQIILSPPKSHVLRISLPLSPSLGIYRATKPAYHVAPTPSSCPYPTTYF